MRIPCITLAAFEELHHNLLGANQSVAVGYASQKQARDKRRQQFELLNQTAQRTKEAVKSQYGPQSSEYKLVKGLKI